MASVGRKDVFIFLRLDDVSVWSIHWELYELGDRLRRTAGIGVGSAEIFERYLNFFFSYLVALLKDVSSRSLALRNGRIYPVLAHLMYRTPCSP